MKLPAIIVDFPTRALGSIEVVLRADSSYMRDWVLRRPVLLTTWCVTVIVIGAGTYGAVMGSWSEWLQAIYAGIKLPLVILLTTLGNGLLNGMLAPLLGLNITFRQSLLMVLLSFAITSVVLCALAPAVWFVVWNTPPLNSATSSASLEYGFLQLTLAVFVGFAGAVGNIRLVPLLQHWSNSAVVARKVLFAWLIGNLFLGSQICWLLRPFIWDPTGHTQFIGKDYLHGSFYETVFEIARRLFF